MNLKERDRLSLFSRVRDGQMTLIEASRRLKLSYRQARRQFNRYRQAGDAGLVHRLRGRPSNNRPAADSRRDRALTLYREHYGVGGGVVPPWRPNRWPSVRAFWSTTRRFVAG